VWEPDEEGAIAFAELPESFARSYLRLRLRNFLYETFCLSLFEPLAEPPMLANDRVSGGLSVRLLEQFQQCNRGQGYFDSGWRIIAQEEEDTLAVEKYGVVLHVKRSRHLLPAHQAAPLNADQHIPIRLPCYRFESGYYIAIGDCGPAAKETAAEETAATTEVYFAASVAAVPTLMELLTSTLNAPLKMPYSLKAPYEPEAYQGPEAMVLRIEKAALETLTPLLHRIRAQHTADELRTETPLFGRMVCPGIAVADVMEAEREHWFGSADLSRVELVAEALAEGWYADKSPMPLIQSALMKVGIYVPMA